MSRKKSNRNDSREECKPALLQFDQVRLQSIGNAGLFKNDIDMYFACFIIILNFLGEAHSSLRKLYNTFCKNKRQKYINSEIQTSQLLSSLDIDVVRTTGEQTSLASRPTSEPRIGRRLWSVILKSTRCLLRSCTSSTQFAPNTHQQNEHQLRGTSSTLGSTTKSDDS